VRRTLIDCVASTHGADAGFEQLDAVAGGETAGIPVAAWMADRLDLPMLYVRKQAKGFGRNAQIEGHLTEGQRVLLVEDMTSDGRSKINFCNALRQAGGKVEHVFVVFFYDIFPEAPGIMHELGVTLHALATWWDVLDVAKKSGKFVIRVPRTVHQSLEVEAEQEGPDEGHHSRVDARQMEVHRHDPTEQARGKKRTGARRRRSKEIRRAGCGFVHRNA